MQSTNEELETSKEELESANEELTTVNEEMANRNAELNRLNSDLLNLQTSTHLAIVLLGRDLTIRRFTAQAEEQFNLLAGDVGRPFSNVRHNLDLPDLEGLVAEVIDSAREREHEVRDKGGRSYSLRVRPYLTLENKIDGAVLVLVDITDLKQTQREITEARDYAESIIRTARDPMLVLGADLRVVSASEAFSQTFKLSQSETEGRLIYEVGNGEWNIPRLRQLLQDIIRHNSFFNDFEATHDFEQIGRRTMLLNARILKDLSGQPAKILVGFHDITARTLFEAAEAARLAAESDKIRAEAAVRAKDDFFAALSHELRTPLNPALLLATSLADDTALPLHVRADIDVIAKGIALQMQLVDDMLDITRIATGKVRLDLRPIDAHIALRNAYEIVRADAREGQIEVTMDLAATHNCIKADAVRVQQIFWNVLQNSVKFTPPGGVITVRTRNPADKKGALVVEIADTGIGIEPEMLGKVFDAFTQGEHSSAHRFGGLGLGLAITQRLIELQNGKISAESLGRNRGTTFRVEFPLAPSKVRPADEPTAGPSVTPSVKARRILLVEDHEQTRSTLAQLLGQRSHSVVGVTTAAAAREIAAARRCDLVISDLGLPDGDGYALMAELGDAYGLPGIALSCYGTEEDVKRSLASGFFAHLTKPVDIHALEAAIAVAPPALSARVLT